jgi:predicted transcriptional regulator
VFATTLSTDPADIPPFELLVDKQKWESYLTEDHLAYKVRRKQAEIPKQVTELLDQGTIEPSTALITTHIVILASKTR